MGARNHIRLYGLGYPLAPPSKYDESICAAATVHPLTTITVATGYGLKDCVPLQLCCSDSQ